MLGIVDHKGFIVIKYGFGLFKGYAVLLPVDFILCFVPLKFYCYNYIIIIISLLSTKITDHF